MASSPCSDAIRKYIEGASESTSAEETYGGVSKLIPNGARTQAASRTYHEGATITVLTVRIHRFPAPLVAPPTSPPSRPPTIGSPLSAPPPTGSPTPRVS